MADDKKNIPDAGKVDEHPKPGKVEPVKADPPVQDQPAPAKADASVVEGASKVATPPAVEQPAPAGMKRPLAYITAAWCGEDYKNTEQAARYCRAVYEAGFSPICPTLYLPLFLNDAVPEEHKSGIDMSRDLLRRSHVLVVCGQTVTEAMKNDIAVAQRLGITATTLEGILTVKGQGRR